MVCNKKRKPVFIKRKWNHVIFSRATILLFHPVYMYIYVYIHIYIMAKELQEHFLHKMSAQCMQNPKWTTCVCVYVCAFDDTLGPPISSLCVYVCAFDRHFGSTYFIIDPFKFLYESFNFWMERIQEVQGKNTSPSWILVEMKFGNFYH